MASVRWDPLIRHWETQVTGVTCNIRAAVASARCDVASSSSSSSSRACVARHLQVRKHSSAPGRPAQRSGPETQTCCMWADRQISQVTTNHWARQTTPMRPAPQNNADVPSSATQPFYKAHNGAEGVACWETTW